MVEEFSFRVTEKGCNTRAEIECSDFFNEMLINGDTEYLLDIFNKTVSMVSKNK